MSLRVERYGPLALTIILTIGAIYYLRTLQPADANKIFGAFTAAGITIATTLLGFLLTIYTIFQATNSRRKVVLLQLGHLPRINGYLRWAVWCLLMSAIALLSVTLIPSETKHIQPSWRIIQIISISITIFSVMLSIRFIYIFLHLVVSDDENYS